MERKRHIDATFDDVYSGLEGQVQSKKSHFEADVTNQYLNGDDLSPNEYSTNNGDTNGDEDELDEFQFVDENPDMSEIQSSNSSHVAQSHVVTTTATQVVTQVVTQTDEDLAQVDEINFQNEKSGNQCYMEMPPAKNTIHQKSEYFDDSRQGKKTPTIKLSTHAFRFSDLFREKSFIFRSPSKPCLPFL